MRFIVGKVALEQSHHWSIIDFLLLIIASLLLCTQLPVLHEVCDSLDQATYCHILSL